MRTSSRIVLTVIAAVAVAILVPALAQPPAHAPAHGFRAKQKNQPVAEVEVRFVSLGGNEWENDYGVKSGNCDRRRIATAIGGIAGALIANRVADEHETVATLIGAAAGAFIGNRIGRNIDKADEACIGHALELGDTGKPVNWTNEETGVSYELVPGTPRTRNGANCREFTFAAVDGSDRSTRQGLGCETEAGVWEIVQ